MRFYRDDRTPRAGGMSIAAALVALLAGTAHAAETVGTSPVSPWLIAAIVIVVLGIGAVLIWLLLVKRPVKLDPRHEQLVRSLVSLARDDREKAFYIIARALVRNGLVWESDLQSVGMTAPSQQQQPQRRRPDSRSGGGSRNGGDSRNSSRSGSNSGSRQPRPRGDDGRSKQEQQPRQQGESKDSSADSSRADKSAQNADGEGKPRSSRRRRRPSRRRGGGGSGGGGDQSRQQSQQQSDKKDAST